MNQPTFIRHITFPVKPFSIPGKFTPYERVMISLVGIAVAMEVLNCRLETAYLKKIITEAECNRQKQEILEVIRERLDKLDLRGDKHQVCFLYEDFAKRLMRDAQAFSPVSQ